MPNNYTTHGDSTYIFGHNDPAASSIASSQGIVPQQITIKLEPEFTQEGKNEHGLTAAFAVSDPKRSMDIQGIITNVTSLETMGSTFQYNGHTFIKMGAERTSVAGEFMKGTVNAVSYVLIS